ncbi:Myb/SANT-like DNA-binding domain [Popillia japonica]|uniref:Regulatory protein zeste n=1 Tax=Popillia japonica TaxID=7064 RepID=A0AAW1HS63_POPJA
MADINEKRMRSANFSNEEKLLCLHLIKKYKHIIESKETGVVTWKQKENVWKIIEKEYNAQSSVYRSADVLKRFYNNKKKEARKVAATVKIDRQATGGGPSTYVPINDPIYDLTLDIINKKTVFGLPSKYDSDAQEYDLTSLPVSENVDNDTLAMEKEETIIIQMDSEENDANEVHNAGWDDCTPELHFILL